MRKNHDNFIHIWVIFMQKHPTEWKKIHTEFINAQFNTHKEFLKRILQESNGKEIVIELYGIKNTKAYSQLLEKNCSQ